jgi:hypothetical protein
LPTISTVKSDQSIENAVVPVIKFKKSRKIAAGIAVLLDEYRDMRKDYTHGTNGIRSGKTKTGDGAILLRGPVS